MPLRGMKKKSQHFGQDSWSPDRDDKKENSNLQLTCEINIPTKI
jgi:hypothetical protein